MIFLKCGVIVAPGSRCCTSHLCEDELTIKPFDHIRVSKPGRWKIDSDEFQMFVEDIRIISFKQKNLILMIHLASVTKVNRLLLD